MNVYQPTGNGVQHFISVQVCVVAELRELRCRELASRRPDELRGRRELREVIVVLPGWKCEPVQCNETYATPAQSKHLVDGQLDPRFSNSLQSRHTLCIILCIGACFCSPMCRLKKAVTVAYWTLQRFLQLFDHPT